MKVLRKKTLKCVIKINSEREAEVLDAMLKGISSYPSDDSFPRYVMNVGEEGKPSFDYINSADDIPSDKEVFSVRKLINKKRNIVLDEVAREIEFYKEKLEYLEYFKISDPIIQSRKDRIGNRLFKLYGLVNILNFRKRSFLAKGGNSAYAHKMVIDFLEKEF